MHPRASNCHCDQTGILEDLLCRERVRDQGYPFTDNK
jgi:hypothetical protein